MQVRAIRGAVQIDADERQAILDGTAELVTAVMSRNSLSTDDVISVIFTATPDLTAEFPALAARSLGFQEVPLLCGTEMSVPAGIVTFLGAGGRGGITSLAGSAIGGGELGCVTAAVSVTGASATLC